jgi:hypothetical protein
MKDFISVICETYYHSLLLYAILVVLCIENVTYNQVSQAPAISLYASEPIILWAWFNIVSLLCLYSCGYDLYGCPIYLHPSDLAGGRMFDVSTVLHLIFEEPFWCPVYVLSPKHEILLCKVLTYSPCTRFIFLCIQVF